MTTINDRIDRLEEAFVQVVPLLVSIDTTLKEHTALLQGIIAKLNEHSVELKFIKEHIG